MADRFRKETLFASPIIAIVDINGYDLLSLTKPFHSVKSFVTNILRKTIVGTTFLTIKKIMILVSNIPIPWKLLDH